MNIHANQHEFGMELLSPSKCREEIENLFLTAEALADAIHRDAELRQQFASLLSMMEQALQRAYPAIIQIVQRED
jgi:hypothetical protein